MSYISQEIFEKIEILKKSGDFVQALDVVNSILMKDPTNEQALLQVADIEYLKGNISNAEKPVDFLMKLKGDNDPMNFYVKGVLEMEKTNWVDAKKYLKKAIQLFDSPNPEALRCYGLAEYWHGNREKGIEFLLKAFQLNNKDAEIIYNLIEIHLLENDYIKANKYIDYYKKNRNKVDTYSKDIEYYDEKIGLFQDFLESIK